MPAIAGCDNGRQAMTSAAPFAVTVWGWGSRQVKLRGLDTGGTSYAYPAGSGLRRLNVVAPPIIE